MKKLDYNFLRLMVIDLINSIDTSAPKDNIMSKAQKNNVEVTSTESTNAVATATAAPTVKQTPVFDRQYKLKGTMPQGLKSKQGSIVLEILAAAAEPMTIKQIAPIAEEKGLNAIGGVEPSVRYHLHMFKKSDIVEVINPTFVA